MLRQWFQLSIDERLMLETLLRMAKDQVLRVNILLLKSDADGPK